MRSGTLRTAAVALIVTALVSVIAQASPAQDYILNCMGCHGADAQGVPGKVPPLANVLSRYMRTPVGRIHVLGAPGAANSALSDSQLAAVLNYVAVRYETGTPVNPPAPFTTREVSSVRHAASPPADLVLAASAPDTLYINGFVYTVDENNSVQEAVAVKDGRITYVGSNAGAKALAAPTTNVVDLQGRMLMPGLVDGHMHPLEGGTVLLKCNLNYERLTVGQFQKRIQSCLERTRSKEPDQWLEVVNWFQQDMLPAGTELTHGTLDALQTRRPI